MILWRETEGIMHNPPLITMLLADDSLDDCELVREAWKEAPVGEELRCVHDGTELLDYLYRQGTFSDRTQSPRPSLILLDLNMPKLNGDEVLARIKNDPLFAGIPIIILTTSRDPRDISRISFWSVNGYVQKPHRFNGYLQMLNHIRAHWEEIVECPFPGHGFGGDVEHLAHC